MLVPVPVLTQLRRPHLAWGRRNCRAWLGSAALGRPQNVRLRTSGGLPLVEPGNPDTKAHNPKADSVEDAALRDGKALWWLR